MQIEEKFKKLKMQIPTLTKPIGSYIPATKAGNLVFTSGQLPITDGRVIHQGRVGKEIKLEQAQFAAKICLINALGAVKSVIGDLDKIKKTWKSSSVQVLNGDDFSRCSPRLLKALKGVR